MSTQEALSKHWHFIAAVLAGAMAVGTLRADVAELKKDQEKTTADHDVLVELRTHQKEQDRKLDDIHADINSILQQFRNQRR
jgi:hypothetical protein